MDSANSDNIAMTKLNFKFVLIIFFCTIPILEIYRSGFGAGIINTGYDKSIWLKYSYSGLACLFALLIPTSSLMRKLPLYFCGIPKVNLIAFLVCGLYSGLLNNNSFFRTILGLADLVKYFIILMGFALFCRCDEKSIRKILSWFYVLGFIACIFAIVDEIFMFFLNYDFMIRFFPESADIIRFQRGPVWGTISIFGHHNGFGYFIAIVTTLFISELATGSKPRKATNYYLALFFITSLLLSTSRTAILAVAIATLVTLYNHFSVKRVSIIKKMLMVASVIAIVLFFANYLGKSIQDDKEALLNDPESTLRSMAALNAVQLVRSSPFFGVGPGSYGSTVSFKMPSPVYENAFFPPVLFEFAQKIESLDSFYSQLFAEYGIVGALLFLFFILRITLYLRKRADVALNHSSYIISSLCLATSGLLFSFFLLFMGGTLNTPLFGLLTCVLAGAALGAKLNNISGRVVITD